MMIRNRAERACRAFAASPGSTRIQMGVEEATDDPIGLSRFGKLRIQQEGVRKTVKYIYSSAFTPAARSRRCMTVSELAAKSRLPARRMLHRR